MKILGVGVATVDIVNEVDSYPAENSETRSRSQRITRGGNATNTLVTLSRLGHECHWAGTLGGDLQGELVMHALARHRIGTDHSLRYAEGVTPTSCVILNRESGSRTILHFRDLPEYPADAFRQIDLTGFDWIHFEGRPLPELAGSMQHARDSARASISLEIEKPRAGIESLFPLADLLLFSRLYAEHRGFDHPRRFLEMVRRELDAPAPALICAWGESGAGMIDPDGSFHASPAFPPSRVVDTLGAGDVFNAALIDRLGRLDRPADALRFACRLAGRKCGTTGLESFDVD